MLTAGAVDKTLDDLVNDENEAEEKCDVMDN